MGGNSAVIRRADVAPGTGKLGVRVVLRHARGMFSADHWRVVGAAFVFFVPPASLHFVAESLREGFGDASGGGRWALLAVLVLVASFIRFLGEIFFAGFLDMAVGASYFEGERRTFPEVLRDLPWRPLLIADIVVNVAVVIGLVFFVVPGLVVLTLFGLVGPVVVQERRSARDGFRRTFAVSRPHWRLVSLLVVIPLAVEHALAEGIRHLVDGGGIVLVVASEWLIAVSLLGIIGVVDVALATELMARTPDEPSEALSPAPS